MGWNAGPSADDDTGPAGAVEKTGEAATDETISPGSKKSVLLILAGLVVTGLVAGWEWVCRLPKD